MTTEISVQNNAGLALFDDDIVNKMWRFGELMASGKVTVPKHLQGSPSDCMAVAMQSYQWGMNPFSVAQKTHLVSGNLGYEAQLVNAVISSSTAIEGRFHYEYSGDWKSEEDPEAWVRVGAVLRGESEVQWGEPLYPALVKTKNSPLWKTAPKQQASYLAVKYWARLFCPAVILGVYTSDELRDIPAEPSPEVSAIPDPEPKIKEVQAEVVEENKSEEPVFDEAEERKQADIFIKRIESAKDHIELKSLANSFKYDFDETHEIYTEIQAAYKVLMQKFKQQHEAEQQAQQDAEARAKQQTQEYQQKGGFDLE